MTTTLTPSSTEPCCSVIYLYGGDVVSQSTTFSVVDCSNNTSTIVIGYNETYLLNCHKTATVISGSGSYEKNDFCICITATPTPTLTTTPTKTPTPTQNTICDDCGMEGVSFAEL
jgi:hypothetical protein